MRVTVGYDHASLSVRLTFEKALINKSTNTLNIKGIKDEAGNKTDTAFSFLYDVPLAGDVLISEFFPDPSPVVGLPDAEFIELYNNSNLPVNLEGWKITDGTTVSALPAYVLNKESFVALCSVHDTSAFGRYGNVLGLNAWPSLNNSSDTIRILDPSGQVIHELVYDNTWYRNDLKDDGGYSIELISAQQLCKGAFNYAASAESRGGTPGKVNSLWDVHADTIAPMIMNAWVADNNTLMLLFNEPLDSKLSEAFFNLTPYDINDVQMKSIDTIVVNITGVFEPNKNIGCFVNGVKDCSGNETVTNIITPYVVPDTAMVFDVVISEIMSAPPAAGNALPAHEYIELYNRSKHIVSLKNWFLEDAAQKTLLNDMILYPDSFVILCAAGSREDFLPFGKVLAVDRFPSLGNDDDALILRNDKGDVIHSISYKRSFHSDAIKAAGGWSLEMKDPQNPCGLSNNWTSSKDISGGTPGKKNASAEVVPDQTTPNLLHIYPLSDTTLRLQFSEPMHPESFVLSSEITGTQTAKNSWLYDPFLMKAEVLLAEKMEADKLYRISITGVTDCVGNEITEDIYFDYGLPQMPDTHDLAINELLFNPFPANADFVEIYNRTGKVLDLKNVWMANTNELNEVKEFYPLKEDGLMLLPFQYAVFTEDPLSVITTYHTPNSSMVFATRMPSFPDDKGCVLLTCSTGLRYDEVCYDEQMHFALLDEKDGVSLERISEERPSNDRTNWASSSYTVGYATPAYKNSQHTVMFRGEKLLEVTPEVFSPDGDGYNDHVQFSYKLSGTENMCNLSIYNDQGLVVKHLLKNALLGTDGVFSWDGITDSGGKAGIGIYVVYFELFDLQGHTTRYKTRLVVAAKW